MVLAIARTCFPTVFMVLAIAKTCFPTGFTVLAIARTCFPTGFTVLAIVFPLSQPKYLYLPVLRNRSEYFRAFALKKDRAILYMNCDLAAAGNETWKVRSAISVH
jgi:hypothetical protein